MQQFDAVIFDHDGTLVDSAEGILKSANSAFARLGYAALTPEEFRPFLGPPLQKSFETLVGMSPEEARQATKLHREAYDTGNCFLLRVHDGMEDLLRSLRERGIKTAVASSKPLYFLEKILSEIGLREDFDAVCGVAPDRLDESKSDIIAAAAQQCGIPLARCVMVGDRRFDIEGAKALGVTSIGLLSGYGSREELRLAGADYIVEDCHALSNLLLG